MAMFGGRPFMPMLQAAMAGQVPGVISEDPRAMAQALGAPVPSTGDYSNGSAAFDLSPAGGHAVGKMPSPGGDSFDQPTTKRVGMFAGGGPLAQPIPSLGVPEGMAGIKDAFFQNAMTPKKETGLFPGNDLKFIATKIFPALLAGMAASQGNPLPLQHMLRMKEMREEAEQRARMPQQVGSSIVQPDSRGGYRTLYSEPTDAERYAAAIGHAPGSPEWIDAIREYRAPAWSPWALEGKEHLEGVRYGYRDQLQDSRYRHIGTLQEDRQEFSRDMQEDRQSHSDAQLGRRLDVTRRGQDLNHQDRQATIRQSDTSNRRTTETSRDNSIRLNETRRQTSRRGRFGNEPVAVGPDGKRYVVRNGQWVPAN